MCPISLNKTILDTYAQEKKYNAILDLIEFCSLWVNFIESKKTIRVCKTWSKRHRFVVLKNNVNCIIIIISLSINFAECQNSWTIKACIFNFQLTYSDLHLVINTNKIIVCDYRTITAIIVPNSCVCIIFVSFRKS